MNRLWLWTAILLLPLGCRAAQEPSEDTATFDLATSLKNEDMATFVKNTTAILANMPKDQRDPFIKAFELDEAGDVRGAESILQPLVVSGSADANISTLLGGLLARDKQWQAASQAYQAALKTLGPEANAFRWNVEWGLGEALLHLERFKEASSHLELALLREVHDDDQYELYELAARAYEGTGEWGLAIQAHIDAVCIEPFWKSGWLALNRATARHYPDHVEWSKRLAEPPSQVRLADALQVARAVDSGQPLSDDDRYAYVRIADAMYQADHVKSGGRFLRAAFRDYLDREWPEAEIRLNPEKTLALLESFGFLPRLTVGTQYHLLSLLAVYRLNEGLYTQVVLTVRMISALQLTESEKEEMTDFLKDYYRTLFAAISFDPATGRPRFADPDDFLGPCMDYSEKSREQAPHQRDPAEVPAKDAFGNCFIKYGALNPAEDLANTSAATSSGYDFTAPLLPILQARIRQEKFDLPVKVVLANLTGGDAQDIEQGKIAGMSLSDLDRAITSAGPGKVHEVTLEAFEAIKESPQLFRMFATKFPQTKAGPQNR